MANFLESLWQSVFTPGPTPTLLLATNATFGALQLLLLVLLAVTRSVHFVVLSSLCGGLWWAINWFAKEIQIAKAAEEKGNAGQGEKERESDAETEIEEASPPQEPKQGQEQAPEPLLTPTPDQSPQARGVRQRNTSSRDRESASSSGYVSEFTDSEWERVSESDEKGEDGSKER